MSYERQHDLLSQEVLASKQILVVGAGAIGRQVCLGLAAMGAGFHVCDMDKVDQSNVATQGYFPADVGHTKVSRVQRFCSGFGAYVYSNEEPWNPRTYEGSQFDIIFSCVDKMDARRSIYLYAKKTGVKIFMDARMLAEMGHIFCYNKDNISEYEQTLFKDEDAIPGRCTARGTYYMAGILANQLLGRMAMELRGIKARPKYTFNLVGEMA